MELASKVQPTRIGILLSGRGSNFLAIADSVASGRIPDAQIAVVISNLAAAPGLTAARQRGLNAVAIEANGRKRADLTIERDADAKTVESATLALDAVIRAIDNRPVKKVVVVPNRIVNVVV